MIAGGGTHASLVAALAVLATLGAVACATDGQDAATPPANPLRATVFHLQESFEAGDEDGICARMSRDAQRQAGKVAHGEPTTCQRDVARALHLIEEGGGWLEQARPRVVAMRSRGRSATVTLAAGRWRAEVPLVEESGSWRLASFFGMAPRPFARLQRATPRRSFPRPGRSVTAADGSGSPCGALSAARYPRISGGCVLRVSGESTIQMMTPFGGFEFSRCHISYRIHVDAEGRTWTDGWQVKYRPRSGCGDLWSCIRKDARVDYLPWKGRIRADGSGGFEHHMQLCLRTCIGPFAGVLVMRIASDPDGRRRRLASDDSGTTGFRLADPLDVRGDRLALAVAGGRG